MTEKSAAVTHFKRLSWKTWISENKAIFIFFSVAFFIGLICGAVAPLIAFFSSANIGLYIPICFAGGLALGIAMIYAVRFVDRKLFGALKAGITAVEDRIISGNSKTHMEDLEKLVAGYLKLKRIEAADYYSRKLLELSKSGSTEIMRLADWMVTTECWVSTEQYNRGWKYSLIWLFETRGILTLSPTKLDFQSRKISFTCTPSNILSIEVKRHPIWLKPIPLRYIVITIDECGMRHTFCLTPSYGQTDTVWDCNRMVDVWYQRLQRFRQTMHPAGAFPDWLKDVQG